MIQRIVKQQIDKGFISENEQEIYTYGYTLLVQKILVVFSMLFICIGFDAWKEILWFCVSFIPVRKYAGGYHAKKTYQCAIVSFLFLLAYIRICRTICKYMPINLETMLCIMLFIAILILAIGPCDTYNKRIHVNEAKKYKKILAFILGIGIGVVILDTLFRQGEVLCFFVVSYVGVLLSLLAGKMGNNRTHKRRFYDSI